MSESIFRVHGIKEQRVSKTQVDVWLEEIHNVGYTVIESGLTPAELVTIREKVDAVYRTQIAELGGEDQLQRINDAKVARCLIEYDDYFVHLAAHEALRPILEGTLGDYYILMSQNGIINDPTGVHYQITWHRDLNYQHFVSSRPIAMSALFCIDEFTKETGGTHVLPASHRSEAFPSKDYVQRHELVVEAPAGSIIVFDAMLFHRSGLNTSGRMRRAVNHIYTLPFAKQQIDLPAVLNGRFSDDPFFSKFLGYESRSAPATKTWREGKLSIAKKKSEPAASSQ